MHLSVIGGPDAGRAVALDKGPVRVGRAGACELPLSDASVSNIHAVITLVDPSTIEVVDLGSTNGTVVNGERVAASRRVIAGQRLQFGQTVVALVPDAQNGDTQVIPVVGSSGLGAPHAFGSAGTPAAGLTAQAQGDLRVEHSQLVGRDLHVHEGLRLRSRMRRGARRALKLGVLLALAGWGFLAYAVLRFQSVIWGSGTGDGADFVEPDVSPVFPWIVGGVALFFFGLVIAIIALLVPRDRVYEEDRRRPRRRR